MKLIIDIPKQCFDFINTHGIQDIYQIEQIIGNGTPLKDYKWQMKKNKEIIKYLETLQNGYEKELNDALLVDDHKIKATRSPSIINEDYWMVRKILRFITAVNEE